MTPLASSVDSATGSTDICNLWKEHYEALLNSVDCHGEKHNVLKKLNVSSEHVPRISASIICEKVKELKHGKAKGHDGLQAEHLTYSSPKLFAFLSMLFNSIIVHSYLPEAIMHTIIIPIIKDSKGDVTSKDNYRPIANTTIFLKLFEIILLSMYKQNLSTTDNQIWI